MDAAVFASGLAFLVLGISVLAQPRELSAFTLAAPLWLLGVFGLVYGAEQLFGLWAELERLEADTFVAQVLVTAAAYLALFEFGRRLLNVSARARMPGWIYAPLLLVLILAAELAPEPWHGFAVWSNLLIGFPGALLAGLALFRYRRLEGDLLPTGGLHTALLVAAGGLAIYALLLAVAGPAAPFFPATVLNEQRFLSVTGLPVELFQAGTALVLTVSLLQVLGMFRIEARDRLSAALERAQRSLIEVRNMARRNAVILEAAGEGIVGLDSEARITFVNPAAERLLGYQGDELVGRSFPEIIRHGLPGANPWEDCPVCRAALVSERSGEDEFVRKDGTAFPVDFTASAIYDDGQLAGAVVAFFDATARREAEQRRRLAARVLEATAKGVLITDAQGVVVSVNQAFLSSTGYAQDEVLGQTPRLLRSGRQDARFYDKVWRSIGETGRWQGEIWNRRKNGEVYPEWVSISAIKDDQGRITHYVAIYSDITAKGQLQQRMHHLAYYDALTELPNRRLFCDHLDLVLAQAPREGHRVAVILIDVDRFKNINDTLGHGTGDRVLKIAAQRVRACVREGDTAARLGGDEFAVMAPSLASPMDAAAIAGKVLEAFTEPFRLDGREFHFTASAGISVFPKDGGDGEQLVRSAETAMYRAKDVGRNNYQFFTEEMSARFRERVNLENALRRAADNGELSVAYQPQYDLESGRIVGIEALARWHHPELGEVPPTRFIPVAEESGLIGVIGEWVLTEACRQAHTWCATLDRDVRIAVNVSAKQLRPPGLEKLVANVLSKTGLAPGCLELELTESALMADDSTTLASLRALNEMRVQLSIDDFGTGYSSLGYLRRFSIDKLKIDQSFVRDIPRNGNDAAIATAIIAMAHSLNLKVLAEGVEREGQLDFLREQGCDEIQGFLFSRPLPAAELGAMLGAPALQ